MFCQTEEMKMKKFVCILISLMLGSVASAERVAYYDFEEGSGTQVLDQSGYGIAANGSLVGTPTWTAGKIGNYAMNFDGSSYIDCGNDTKFDLSTAITITAWLKADGASRPGQWEMWLSKGNTSGWRSCQNGYQEPVNTTMFFGVNGDQANLYGSHTALDGTWHHVACTFDSTAGYMAIYVDGQLDNFRDDLAGVQILQNPGVNVWIGSCTEWTGGTWIGQMDEVTVWNEALNAEQIQAMVPEPVTLSLLGLGGLVLLRKRK